MTDEERLKLLEEMREAFRKARPDLDLPPARRNTAAPSGTPVAPSTEAEEERDDDVRRKLQALRETAREKPNTIVGMLKRFTDRNGKR